MTIRAFNLQNVHPSWKDCIQTALTKVDPLYLEQLSQSTDWLPGPDKIFSAFSLPISEVNYVLFGESPYPRKESANGYAFWDASVQELWSSSGLSKKVNRATSLRNIIKMLLVAEGRLHPENLSQEKISAVDKTNFIATNNEFFSSLLGHGFLLLNATLVLQSSSRHKDAQQWVPFIRYILDYLLDQKPNVKFILLGRIANLLDQILPKTGVEKIYAEHPYNLTFVTNEQMINFFKPLHILIRS